MGTRETLRSIAEAGRTSNRLDELGAAHLIGRVAEQVHAAHQKAGAGKAIGPITPAAIVVGDGGAIELALADRGHAIGYSAPEMLAGSADRRSDVFSLGIVMWEVLTQQRLFEAMNDAAAKIAVKEREIKSPAEVNANVPAELAAICMRALARNPADRYGSAKAMGVEIEEFLSEAGYDGGDAKLAAYVAEVAKPAAAAKPAEPKTLVESPAPAAPVAAGLPPIESVAAFAPPVTPKPPVLPDNPKATIAATVPPMPAPAKDTIPDGQIAQSLKADEPAAPQPVASNGSAPHPASVVSLPHAGRDSRSDVLSSWAWQTDSVEALHDDGDDLHAMHSNRKPLLYVIGGGLALAAIVTIIAVGFGGSSDKKKEPKPQPVATTQEGSADRAMSASAPGGAELASGAQPQVAVAGSAAVGSAAAGVVETGSGSAAAAGSGSETGSAPGSEPGSGSAPGSAAVAVAPPEPTKVEPAKTEPTKAEPTKTEPTKTEPSKKTDTKVAKAEPAKTEPKKTETKTAKADTKATRTQKGQLADPFAGGATPKKADTKIAKKSEGPKVDVESAYRVGLQQFARGDTSGALASLRTSLASNPNYPPTWRGLGLVFEKLGEKDQARAAYKRYLQLAPNAGDAEQIRGRLERLGS